LPRVIENVTAQKLSPAKIYARLQPDKTPAMIDLGAVNPRPRSRRF